MPSSAKPLSSFEPKKDVKPEPEEPSVQETEKPEIETEAKEEDSVEEKDLELLEEDKKIPYARFKEKVDESKRLKDEVQKLIRQREDDIRRAVEDAEVRTRLTRKEETGVELDPYEAKIQSTQVELEALKRELKSLKGESDYDKLQTRLDRLKAKYPDADEIAVMGWKKVRPEADLEELMAESHTRSNDRAQEKIRKILEHKKAKARQATPTSGGIRLKPTDKPKNTKEAFAQLRKAMGF